MSEVKLPPLEEVTIKDHPVMAAQPTFVRPVNPEVTGSVLWLRNWKLSIGDQSGDNALDLSPLAFTFSVEQSQTLVPWRGVITIYNVGDDVIVRMARELTYIYLEAGYQAPSTQYGKVFGGPITYYEHGRMNATDTFVIVTATQYDQPLSAAVINTYLPVGHTRRDIIQAVAQGMNIELGHVPKLPEDKATRSRTLYGMAKDILYDEAQTLDAQVFIGADGKLHILTPGEKLEMEEVTVPILNSHSGLIDVPTQTMGGGVNIRCLLNPAIVPGGQVEVDQKAIRKFQAVDPSIAPQTAFELDAGAGSLNADGYYLVYTVRHWGENRGNPWYSEIVTMPIDPSKVVVGVRPSV